MKKYLRPLACSLPFVLLAFGFGMVQVKGQESHHPVPPIIHPPIMPPRPWPPRHWPLPERDQELKLRVQRAEVFIQGPLAKIQLKQTFENTTGRRVEGTYLFPLPQGAAVSGFAMTINGKRTEAELLDREKAREIYEGIVAKLRDPAILEYTDRDLLRARIFPVEPGARVEMELVYNQAVRPQGASFQLQIPQKLPVGGTPDQSTLLIHLSAENLKGVYSPSHKTEIKREGDKATISGEWSGPESAGRDFTLIYSAGSGKVGLSATVYQSKGEDPYFLVLAAPDAAVSAREVAAKDVVFVFDTSGSMAGKKIEQARNALQTLLGNLNPADRFNVVTFASDTNVFRDSLQSASPANLAAARQFSDSIKAIGATNINEALQTGLKMMDQAGDRPRQIVFMTDGQPTVGETAADNILKNALAANRSNTRLFVFGVGYDVNTRLLDNLAEENRGAADYVAPEEDLEVKVGALYSKIAYPVVANPELKWEGATAYDVYPRRTPDLFKGSQLVIFGRLRPEGKVGLTMTGLVNGKTERIEGQVGTSLETNEMVSRIWATRKIGFLLADARQNNRPVSEEARTEIIKLSKRYGIVTPFTASLVTEDEVPVNTGGPRRNLPGVPRPMFDLSPAAAPAFNGSRQNLMDSTGESGVAAAKSARDLRETTQAQSSRDIRTIAGKSFTQVSGVWTEVGLDTGTGTPVRTVKFASPEYFQLSKDATVARWLSLGDKVTFLHGGTIWKVEP